MSASYSGGTGRSSLTHSRSRLYHSVANATTERMLAKRCKMALPPLDLIDHLVGTATDRGGKTRPGMPATPGASERNDLGLSTDGRLPALEGAHPLWRPRHVGHLRRGLLGRPAPSSPGRRPVPCHLAGQSLPRCRSSSGPDRTDWGSRPPRRSLYRAAGFSSWAKSPDDQATARLASLLELGNPGAEWPMRIGSKKGSVTSMPGLIPPRAAGGSQSSTPSVSNAPCQREIRRVGRTIRTCFGKLGLPVGDYLRSRPPQPPLLDAPARRRARRRRPRRSGR